ncbi:hypothetical protein RC1_1816 [Rhodospirillum centenum SW]|uniref:Uncharacterized protein n=1 Tax=Rhodospirillum centenum (strain ATCC 51521 / SW) TaxID=414684 RepID=B6INM9_RHOCS|nr:hypothetical protein RC1_1816 [Rhodospirillum centenum SW]
MHGGRPPAAFFETVRGQSSVPRRDTQACTRRGRPCVWRTAGSGPETRLRNPRAVPGPRPRPPPA